MKTIHHPLCNTILRGNSQLGIADLHITKEVIDGFPMVASYWQPSEDELKRLNEGKPVVLMVMASTHPPVNVAVLEV